MNWSSLCGSHFYIFLVFVEDDPSCNHGVTTGWNSFGGFGFVLGVKNIPQRWVRPVPQACSYLRHPRIVSQRSYAYPPVRRVGKQTFMGNVLVS